MNCRRTPVVAALALALSGLAVAAPAAASETTIIRNQVDIVFVSVQPDGDEAPTPWKSEEVIWDEIRAAAAYYTAETGVDFQFVDPTFRHLYVDASLCASTWATIDWDAIYAAFGTTEADYTTRDTGANRHLFAVFHPSCYTGAQSFTKAEPGTLDTGGRVVINDRDIAAWPDFNFYLLVHELGHTFGFEHVFTEVCEQDSDPATLDWDQAAHAGEGVTCSTTGHLWTIEGLAGSNTPLDRRTDVHLTGFFKYELGVIAPGAGATVIDQPTTGTTVALGALPTTDPGVTQTILVKVPGGAEVFPANSGWTDGTDYTLAVEYYGDVKAQGDDGETGVFITALLWDGVSRNFSEGFIQQPVTGPYRYQYALAPGETFTTADGRVRITTEAVTAATATVRIEVDGVDDPGDDPDDGETGQTNAFVQILRFVVQLVADFIRSLLALFA
jgi:hypothetical protein